MIRQSNILNGIKVGERVHILEPKYGMGQIGSVIAEEEGARGVHTGYWLVQIEETDIILALLENEIEPFRTPCE